MATFTSLGLFRQVPCPEGRRCRLFHCLFSHSSAEVEPRSTTPVEAPPEWLIKASREKTPLAPAVSTTTTTTTTINRVEGAQNEATGTRTAEPPAKRRRVEGQLGNSPQGQSTDARSTETTKSSTPLRRPMQAAPPSSSASSTSTYTLPTSTAAGQSTAKTKQQALPSLTKPIHPPTISRSNASTPTARLAHSIPPLAPTPLSAEPSPTPAIATAAANAAPKRRVIRKEPLNPRLIAKSPTSHSSRLAIVKKLHQALDGLNKKTIAKYKDNPKKRDMVMLEHELVGMALDEEEKVARENASLYNNVIRMRIVKFMKMGQEEWEKIVREYLRLDQVPATTTTLSASTSATAASAAKTTSTTTTTTSATATAKKQIDTGLPASLELLLLPKLLARPSDLRSRNYILSKPDPATIEESQRTTLLAQNFEKCERCNTRFQVFPGRRATDGALSTNGPCVYHPSKAYTPRGTSTDHITGMRQPVYPCCGEGIGVSRGCEKCESHVWKTGDAGRLAAVLQFEETPEPEPDTSGGLKEYRPLTFDCEMSYTTLGLELVRLTAASWPDGKIVIDALVRPYGEILDFNTRYSGVDARLFANAHPYGEQPTEESKSKGIPSLPLLPTPAAARSLLFTYLRPSTPLIGHALENDLNVTRIIHPSIVDTAILFPHPRAYAYSLKTLALKYLNRKIQSGGGTQGAEGHDSLEDAVVAGELVRWKIGEVWKGMKGVGWKIEGGKIVSDRGRVLGESEEGAKVGVKRKA